MADDFGISEGNKHENDKDDDRRGRHEHEKFDFLGYTFRARRSKNRHGKYFVNFSPAVSNKAAKAMRQKMRGWGVILHPKGSIPVAA